MTPPISENRARFVLNVIVILLITASVIVLYLGFATTHITEMPIAGKLMIIASIMFISLYGRRLAKRVARSPRQ
jgi:uncharacterized membrane protein